MIRPFNSKNTDKAQDFIYKDERHPVMGVIDSSVCGIAGTIDHWKKTFGLDPAINNLEELGKALYELDFISDDETAILFHREMPVLDADELSTYLEMLFTVSREVFRPGYPHDKQEKKIVIAIPKEYNGKQPYTKVGNIYSVKIDESTTKYFQYIGWDRSQMGGEIIRAFSQSYSSEERPDPDEIVKGTVDFYAHTIVGFGVKQHLWMQYGHSPDIGNLKALFRSNDYLDHPKIISFILSFLMFYWFVDIWRPSKRKIKVPAFSLYFFRTYDGAILPVWSIYDRIVRGYYSYRYCVKY